MNKKSMVKTIFFALIVGILMGVLCVLAGLITGKDQYGQYVFVFGIILIILFGFVQIWRMSNVNKKVKSLTTLLTVEKEPKRYVEEMKELLAQTKQKQQKDVLKINIATGLSQCGEFQEAIDMLGEVSVKNQPMLNQVICYNNMITNFYLMDLVQDAENIWNEKKTLFLQFEQHEIIGENIKINKALKWLAEGEIEKAKSNLKQVDRTTISAHTNDLVDYLTAKIFFLSDQDKNGNEIIDKMQTRKLTPSIQAKIQGLLKI